MYFTFSNKQNFHIPPKKKKKQNLLLSLSIEKPTKFFNTN